MSAAGEALVNRSSSMGDSSLPSFRCYCIAMEVVVLERVAVVRMPDIYLDFCRDAPPLVSKEPTTAVRSDRP